MASRIGAGGPWVNTTVTPDAPPNVPPPRNPLPAAILAAWAVGFTVTSYLLPAGTAGIPVDNPPVRQQVAPDVSQWQVSWAAQGRNRGIAAFTGSVDAPLPKTPTAARV